MSAASLRPPASVHLARALVVGLLAGGVGVAFRVSLEAVDGARMRLGAWSAGSAPAALCVVLLCGACAAAAVALVRRLAPETSGSGIPQVEAAVKGWLAVRWPRVLPVKFAGGLLAMGGGLALGREGPTVQMGAGVGAMVASLAKVGSDERSVLLAAGAGAGLATAFNAPLAGVVFVLEELRHDLAPAVLTPVVIASVAADALVRVFFGPSPIYRVETHSPLPLEGLMVSAVIGLTAAVIGTAFNRGLVLSLDLFAHLASRGAVAAAFAVGALMGLASVWDPLLVGDGHALVERILLTDLLASTLVGLLMVRFAMTLLSYGCGSPGGIFAPLLVLGAANGRCVGALFSHLMPALALHLSVFTAIGMGAAFTAIVRAPLTGVVLTISLTGRHDLVLHLMLASVVAGLAAEAMGARPIYDLLLERAFGKRDLSKEGTPS